MEDDAREDPAAPNLEEQVERLRTELGRKKQELERTRKRHDELASLISRRDFLAAGVTAAGTAVLAGLLGYGIRAWTDADEQPILVTAPGPTDQTVDLFVYPRVKVAQLSAVRVGEPVTFEYPLRGKPAMLVKVGSPAKFGIGPDGD
ncbi:MAG: twin-arginine translocation signal domain-containing protein, partial [Actinobacteria bacterium]|nr:twin-arginine translocation signal domain-containing protein [Actinomycetota bacterium]